jgi:hypothetical protein
MLKLLGVPLEAFRPHPAGQGRRFTATQRGKCARGTGHAAALWSAAAVSADTMGVHVVRVRGSFPSLSMRVMVDGKTPDALDSAETVIPLANLAARSVRGSKMSSGSFICRR